MRAGIKTAKSKKKMPSKANGKRTARNVSARRQLLKRLSAEYTPETCLDTLQINEEIPIAGEHEA